MENYEFRVFYPQVILRFPDSLLPLHRKTTGNALRCTSKNKNHLTQPTGGELQTKNIKATKTENARLRVALREERLRTDAYDEMIRVAETKYSNSSGYVSGRLLQQ
jgi:hypothetical protein